MSQGYINIASREGMLQKAGSVPPGVPSLLQCGLSTSCSLGNGKRARVPSAREERLISRDQPKSSS